MAPKKKAAAKTPAEEESKAEVNS
jgi:hypothetical protein